ncbi:MAG: PRC-barrel domain-containing protein [Candidatus Rokuibacteriota bacterium]
MLTGAREMCGWPIRAEDDEVGHVSDVYFDDRRWIVRYLVVDTRHWPVGRSVLISPRSVSGLDRQALRTSLSRSQVALGPDLDLARPVSRQHDLELLHYYGFPSYAVTVGASVALAAPMLARKAVAGADPHLRSVRAITGYFVHAIGGDVGHVEDFLVDDDSWAIRHLLVSVRSWLAIHRVLVPVGWIARVSWGARAVEVSLPAEAIRLAPTYDRTAGVSREHEARLGRYYGPPPFTDQGARS